MGSAGGSSRVTDTWLGRLLEVIQPIVTKDFLHLDEESELTLPKLTKG